MQDSELRGHAGALLAMHPKCSGTHSPVVSIPKHTKREWHMTDILDLYSRCIFGWLSPLQSQTTGRRIVSPLVVQTTVG